MTGAGRFVDDIVADGALHAAFVRCATGPDRVASPDLTQALAISGVRLAVTANETAGLGEIAVNGLGEPLAYPPQPPLMRGGESRAIGQIIAMVVAATRSALRSARLSAPEVAGVAYQPATHAMAQALVAG